MAKIIFQDEQGQNLNRYKMTPVEGQADTYDLERAANITQQGTPYNKEVGDHFLQVEDGTPVQTLTCTKSGTVYALTGLTATSGKVPVMFSVPTAYASWDTVTIDGTAYTLKTRDGSTLTAGAWAAGAIITGTADVDAKTLTVEPSAPVGAVPAYDYGGTQTDANACLNIGIFRSTQWLNKPPDSTDAQGIIIVLPYGPSLYNGYGWTRQIFVEPHGTRTWHRQCINQSWGNWSLINDGGHAASADTAADTTSINSALTVTTAAPSSTLAAGKLWGVY